MEIHDPCRVSTSESITLIEGCPKTVERVTGWNSADLASKLDADFFDGKKLVSMLAKKGRLY